MVIELDGETLTRAQVIEIAYGRAKCAIAKDAADKVIRSREQVEQSILRNQLVYGVTTGFGKLSDVRIAASDVRQLQMNLLRSHAVGVGDMFPREVVRAMLALRANALAKGFSGIQMGTLQLLVDMLNAGVHPVIPSQGSLGASGDLAPLAHMALVLIGEGRAEVAGEELSGRAALGKVGLCPVELGAKEGLALINGTQAMSAVGLIALTRAMHVGLAADAALALTMEALRAIPSAFDESLLLTRPHPEPLEVARRVRAWLCESQRLTASGEVRVQDAYSIRCAPQVHGASWQAWKYAEERLAVEINSATDNPIVLTDGRIISGGQFHGQPIAIAMDLLKIGAAEWASISERRIERLVNPQLSGLTPFLAKNAGLESGLMIAQYVAAALVSENKVLAHPASVDSIPSSANQEDHVSMGTIAARQAQQIVNHAARVIAIEWLCASQALHMQEAEERMAPATHKLLTYIRSIVPPLDTDASMSAAVEQLAMALLRGEVPLVEPSA